MPLQTEYNKDTIKESILNKLLRYYGCTIEDATPKQIYAAVASTVRDQIMLKWRFEKEARRSEKAKRLYYLSIEFLTGRWLHNNLLNLCSTKEYEEAFEELGLTLRGVLHEEPENPGSRQPDVPDRRYQETVPAQSLRFWTAPCPCSLIHFLLFHRFPN